MSTENEKERKERVIHTRVPESLDEEIRKRASTLGMSVSNLVRNALKNAFGLVEDAINDSANVARTAAEAVDPTTVSSVGGPPDQATPSFQRARRPRSESPPAAAATRRSSADRAWRT